MSHGNIIKMQVRTGFVHVNISPNKPQIRVSFFKALYILHKGFLCPFPHFWLLKIIFTTPLHHIFVEQLFSVFRLLDMVIIILYFSVSSFLLAIVLFQSVPKNFLIHLPYVSIYQSDIFSRF